MCITLEEGVVYDQLFDDNSLFVVDKVDLGPLIKCAIFVVDMLECIMSRINLTIFFGKLCCIGCFAVILWLSRDMSFTKIPETVTQKFWSDLCHLVGEVSLIP